MGEDTPRKVNERLGVQWNYLNNNNNNKQCLLKAIHSNGYDSVS